MTIELRDQDGELAVVRESKACDLVGTFTDGESQLNKAALTYVKLTLYDKKSRQVVNGRNGQSVKDENNGTVAADGTLTIELQSADNAIIGDLGSGLKQTRVARLEWGWLASDGVTERHGGEQLEYEVENWPTVVVPA